MGALISQADYDYIRSCYPRVEIKPLSVQQEQLIMHYMRGLSTAAAARAVGVCPATAKKLLELPHVEKLIDYLRHQRWQEARVDRELLTQMLFEAHAKSANATEEIAAIRELGKLHGEYESDRQRGVNKIEVNGDLNINNVKQIERASTEELLQLAGQDIVLDPSQYVELHGDDADE